MKGILLFLLLLVTGQVLAQHTPVCGFTDAHLRRFQSDKQYAAEIASAEKLVAGYIEKKRSARMEARIYTLPVVFHVINTGGAPGAADNPSDDAIKSTLALLNAAWRKNGAAYGGVDMEIQFVLAARGPGCSATTGINRVNGSGTANYQNDGITNSSGGNQAEIKQLSRWSSADYINIWIVTKINGSDTSPGGFAYFPAHAESKIDGITILANTVDSANKTIVHEMGHVFGLYHTFRVSDSDESSCPPTNNCADTGDMVCDTEPSLNVACSTTTNTCPDPDVPFLVADVAHNYTVVNNYMGTNSCQFMFTNGQKDRVHAFLELYRPGLIGSEAASLPAAGPVSAATVSAGTSLFYGVERVKFNTIDIYSGTSVQDDATYIDRTCNQRTSVAQGSMHTLTITSTYNNPQYLFAYIDYDNSGTFSESEKVVSSDWTGSVIGDVTIPPLAAGKLNIPLRMRIVSDNNFGFPPTATVLSGQGQVEDFTLIVNSALPVTLIYFRGKLINNNQVNLSWATSAEDNTRSFVIERGPSLASMKEIAQPDAAGHSGADKDYQYTDTNPDPGVNYYRLSVIDQDGSRTAYHAISVDKKSDEMVFPNPSENSGIFVQASADNQIRLFNITGSEIPCKLSRETANRTRLLPDQTLTSGEYLISIQGKNGSRALKLIIP